MAVKVGVPLLFTGIAILLAMAPFIGMKLAAQKAEQRAAAAYHKAQQ